MPVLGWSSSDGPLTRRGHVGRPVIGSALGVKTSPLSRYRRAGRVRFRAGSARTARICSHVVRSSTGSHSPGPASVSLPGGDAGGIQLPGDGEQAGTLEHPPGHHLECSGLVEVDGVVPPHLAGGLPDPLPRVAERGSTAWSTPFGRQLVTLHSGSLPEALDFMLGGGAEHARHHAAGSGTEVHVPCRDGVHLCPAGLHHRDQPLEVCTPTVEPVTVIGQDGAGLPIGKEIDKALKGGSAPALAGEDVVVNQHVDHAEAPAGR